MGRTSATPSRGSEGADGGVAGGDRGRGEGTRRGMSYKTLAEVLLAYRPVLRTLSPQKDLAALEVVLWKGTYKRHRKLEDQAAPVQEKLNALSVLDGMRFLHNSPNAIEVLDEMRHSNYKFIGQMKHRIDLQWTIAVAEDYVNEKIAVSIYLGDLFNIAADHDPLVEIFKHVDREKEIFEHLQLDDLGNSFKQLYQLGVAASGVVVPVIHSVPSTDEYDGYDEVLEWKPLGKFTPTDFSVIADWYTQTF